MRRNVRLSDDEAERLLFETPCGGKDAETLVESAEDESTARVKSCRYGLRSGARRKISKRTTVKVKSSLVRKRAKKSKDDVTEASVKINEAVKCLEGEFLSVEKSEGMCSGG